MDFASIVNQLPRVNGAPSPVPFQRSYVRPETMGGYGTPAIAAAMQMFDPRGLSPDQLDRNAAMQRPLLSRAFNEYPGLSGRERPPYDTIPAERNSLMEDLNSVMIKYGMWRKEQTGQELSPQDRVTQGFLDVRNPNSWF
jgi:hypothetical protein